MTTGIFRVARSVLIDRELTCQTGRGLLAWANAQGVPYAQLIAAIETDDRGSEWLLGSLADTLGVTVAALRGESTATNASLA